MPHGATSMLPPVLIQDAILFRTESPSDGRVLWRTDGTTAGTSRIAVLDDSTSAFLPSMVELGIGFEPITETCFVMDSCWPLPTGITVGSGPVAGLPSPSVGRSGSSTVSATAWLLMTVPAGVPALTRTSN